MRRTALFEEHLNLGARMVDFAGWEMPVQYAGVIEEHRAVRASVGVFDLGHMGEIWVRGPHAGAALDRALVSLPSALNPGRAQYSIAVNESGGMIDDLLVYRVADEEWLVVANASNAERVAALLAQRIGTTANVSDESASTAMIAVQGPQSGDLVASLFDAKEADAVRALRNYACRSGEVLIGGTRIPLLVARTGYTGEDGFEFYLPADRAVPLWRALLTPGTSGSPAPQPIGLGARDTLRLEAGMPLFGNELREELTPFDVGLGRVVKFNKGEGVVGDAALTARAAAGARAGRALVGLKITGRGIARHGYEVHQPDGGLIGHITSGTHSPTLGYPIALADLDASASPYPVGEPLDVLIRGERVAAVVTGVPFVPKGSIGTARA
ncbi:MAG TPA: glycine cleavage system aminomethyltransferase GcvT [Chloroflexi bacterium]|nr:glycine cleavage system aminomethyltransferase GcvT [Chloroflexota bacterium]